MDPEQKLRIFFENYPEETVKKGKILLAENHNPQNMYYLVKGFVRQYAQSAKNEILYLHVYRPGSCFPLMWLFNETSNRFYYESLTDIVIKKAPKDKIEAFLEIHPDLVEYFMQRILLGMHGLLTRMESIVLDDAYTRTASLFLYFARLFGKKDGKGTIISVPLSHKQIGSWVGVARETATLMAEKLKKKGLIKYVNRHYQIPSIQNLSREVEKR